MRDVVELAGRWGVSPGELLEGLPVEAGALRDPSTRVPIEVCQAVVERAHELSGEPALALYMGWQMRVSSHGFLGFAAMTADTVREAIDLAVRFSATRTTAIGLSLYVESGSASLVIEERAPLGSMREFAILGLMVGLWQLGQALTGRRIGGAAECDFPAPDYLENVPFARALVRFDRPSNRLVFDASLLDLPLESADPVATQLAREQCEQELALITGTGFPARVRAALADTLESPPGIDELARELHVSTRTLKRRLAEHDTSYSAILEDTRRQRALLLLDNRSLSIGEVAARLGYSELSSFTRAFRKWTGLTPAAYRRSEGKD